MFVLGKQHSRSQGPRMSQAISLSKDSNLPGLSTQATLGRNSQFRNLTAEDRERLGGIEYRSLKVLLKIVVGKGGISVFCRVANRDAGYFFGLHLFGIICLVGWVQYAPAKYRDYIASCGLNQVWW